MCVQGVEEWAEDAALRSTSVEDQGRWCVVPHSDHLTSACQEVHGLSGRMLLIFLLRIPHRFSVEFRSGELAGQSSTVISWSENYLEVALTMWAGAKVLLEKEISISIKPCHVSRWKHKVLQNLLVDSCIDFGLDKTQWTNTSRRHGTPNHPWLQKHHTRLQVAWIMCLFSLSPDYNYYKYCSVPLVSLVCVLSSSVQIPPDGCPEIHIHHPSHLRMKPQPLEDN